MSQSPETVDDQESRRRSVERMRQQAANGYAPVRRRNGHDQAPAAEQINWAQVIAESELRYERQIGALKEQVTELVAKPESKSGGISEEEVTAIAKATARLVRDRIAERVAPLEKRIDELENIVRAMVQSVADSKRVTAIPYGDADSEPAGRFVHTVDGIVQLSP